jgi:hypothetical protein
MTRNFTSATGKAGGGSTTSSNSSDSTTSNRGGFPIIGTLPNLLAEIKEEGEEDNDIWTIPNANTKSNFDLGELIDLESINSPISKHELLLDPEIGNNEFSTFESLSSDASSSECNAEWDYNDGSEASYLLPNQSTTKYKMKVAEITSRSRVENLIKVKLTLYPPPTETNVHLEASTISKPKFLMKTPYQPSSHTLDLEAIVLRDGNQDQNISMCPGCIKRERKRASRKKSPSPKEQAHWSEDKERKIVVLNCPEMIQLGPYIDVDLEDGRKVKGRQLTFPMRLTCYCRHHDEKTGFRVRFVARDCTGNIAATGITNPVMVTDDHKGGSAGGSASSDNRPSRKRRKADNLTDETIHFKRDSFSHSSSSSFY